jgi:hypothetical protein
VSVPAPVWASSNRVCHHLLRLRLPVPGGHARGRGGLGPLNTMGAWWNERNILALLIAAMLLLAAWMVRFEWADKYGFYHRNRFTGVVCYRTAECWFSTER